MKLAVVGFGQVIGDDDIIAERPYNSTITCIKNDSFMYLMPRADYIRLLKRSGDCWNMALNISKQKEFIDK